MRYIETERYRLERKARKALFGLYRNPFTHHPCVRGAIDSTANTNLIYWAGYLLALEEVALPYAVDPNTLSTIRYDPFESQVRSESFTAHPKVDPFTNELVVFGYEATGLVSLDVATYTLNSNSYKRTIETRIIIALRTYLACNRAHESCLTHKLCELVTVRRQSAQTPFRANAAGLVSSKRYFGRHVKVGSWSVCCLTQADWLFDELTPCPCSTPMT
jgi:hypothetical protein